ncbi:hypothetical protein [Mariniflexile sp.]|uniref:hypothetical protein n=1 Tax=Mariniflexile sp. TaxID=1979402 RepID=UPI004047EA15
MKIKYKKRRLYTNLIMACIWIVFGIFNVFADIKTRWFDYGYLVIGALYSIQFLYEFKNQYLTIKNGIIKKNSIFRKEINMDEINWIKKFAGEYTLKTDSDELKINTDFIEEESLTALNKILSTLKLPVERTPFVNV